MREYTKRPEAQRRRRARYFMKKYGLELAEIMALIEEQGEACATCGAVGRLVVDHDHTTGSVRGLLCHRCNLALGQVRDDPNVLRALIAYLETL